MNTTTVAAPFGALPINGGEAAMAPSTASAQAPRDYSHYRIVPARYPARTLGAAF